MTHEKRGFYGETSRRTIGIAALAPLLGLLAACDGPPPRPVASTCAGIPIPLTPEQSIEVAGSFDSQEARYRAYCASFTEGPVAIYTIAPNASGTLKVEAAATTRGSNFALFAFRAGTCGNENQVSHCARSSDGSARLSIDVEPGAAYSVAIKGEDERVSYTATFELAAASCGDGVINPGEKCDFGQDNAASGCDPKTCQYMALDPPATDSCPGFEPMLKLYAGTYSAAKYPELSGYTTNFADDYPPYSPNGAPDRLYAFRPIFQNTPIGALTVKAVANFDVVLTAYQVCDGAPNELIASADSDRKLADETVTFGVNADVIGYHVVVDGYDATSFGHFELEVSFLPIILPQ